MKKFAVYLNLILAMIIWGLTFVWTKQVLVFYGPITIIFFRLLISTLFLLVANLFLKQIQRIEKKDLLFIIILSFFQPFLYFICENYGLKLTGATVTAIIVATIPLFTPFAGYFFFKERFSKYLVWGLVISFVGVFMVIIKNNFTLAVHPLGIIILMTGVVFAILYTAMVYKISGKYNSFSILFWQNLFGTAMLVPLLYFTEFSEVSKIGFKSESVVPLLLLAILGSSVAYIFYIKAIRELGVTVANLFTNIVPVATAVFAFYLLGEKITLLNTFGIFLVVSGVIFSQIKKAQPVKT